MWVCMYALRGYCMGLSVCMHVEGACSSGELLCKRRKVSRGISR